MKTGIAPGATTHEQSMAKLAGLVATGLSERGGEERRKFSAEVVELARDAFERLHPTWTAWQRSAGLLAFVRDVGRCMATRVDAEEAKWTQSHDRLVAVVELGYLALASEQRTEFLTKTFRRYHDELATRRADFSAEKRQQMTVDFASRVMARLATMPLTDSGMVGSA